LWKRILLFSSRGFLTIYFYLGLKRKRLCMSSQNQQVPLSLKWKFFYGIIVLEEDRINEGHPLFDVYYSDDEQQSYPTFDHYKDTEEPVSKQNHPMVPIYDEYESDLGESQEEEHKEPVE
jgi:hypothetical protein